MQPSIKEKIALVPKNPGCYIMKDNTGKIIYVGKAKNLSNRMKTYFTGSHDAKTTKMVSLINDFEYIITSNETEALVLELNLIKQHNPKYNILLTDDKTYPYICITSEKHPRIIYTREIRKFGGKYYGPFPNAKAAKETVNLLNRLYPLRKCVKLPKKECLYYHLGQCLAPCIHPVEQETYTNISDKIHRILKGDTTVEIKSLKTQMQESSAALDYEKALEIRNNIFDLEALQEKQTVDSTVVEADIFGYYVENETISIQVFHVRNGKMIERSGNVFDIIDDVVDMFSNFIAQFYVLHKNPIPAEIITSLIPTEQLAQVLGRNITVPKRGKKKELLVLAENNAKQKITELILRSETLHKKSFGALEELQKLLLLSRFPSHIEAFDNSNIQGESAVSAMVVYIEGKPQKKLYRKYKIKTVQGPDDFATMYEVIFRRYKKLQEDQSSFPDLIIVDGGMSQVAKAKEALNELHIEIEVIGLVKNDKHTTEAIHYKEKNYVLPKRSGLFLFLSGIQEEVHRYAITFHHLVHSKNVLSSELDSIPGIGPVKKKEILKVLTDEGIQMESLQNLNLTKEQIEEVLRIFRFRS